jgi:hypothetical protein
MRANSRTRTLWSLGAVAAFVMFTLAWLVGGSLQIDAYTWTTHDISDLGALTARLPWVVLVPEGIAGVLTIGFALFVLRPALAVPGRREALAPWMIVVSLSGLDNISDVFFRLDCMAAEASCSEAARAASISAQIHMMVGLITALITVVTPFALAWRLRQVPTARRLFWPAIGIGIVLVCGLAVYVALDQKWGQGIVQRGVALVATGSIAALAWYLLSRSSAGASIQR